MKSRAGAAARTHGSARGRRSPPRRGIAGDGREGGGGGEGRVGVRGGAGGGLLGGGWSRGGRGGGAPRRVSRGGGRGRRAGGGGGGAGVVSSATRTSSRSCCGGGGGGGVGGLGGVGGGAGGGGGGGGGPGRGGGGSRCRGSRLGGGGGLGRGGGGGTLMAPRRRKVRHDQAERDRRVQSMLAVAFSWAPAARARRQPGQPPPTAKPPAAPTAAPTETPAPSPTPEPIAYGAATVVSGTESCTFEKQGTTTTDADGTGHYRGAVLSCTDTSNDPRVSGPVTYTWEYDGWAQSAHVPRGTGRLENAGGAWDGTMTGSYSTPRGDILLFWFEGSGGYEGLSYAMWALLSPAEVAWTYPVDGIIFPARRRRRSPGTMPPCARPPPARRHPPPRRRSPRGSRRPSHPRAVRLRPGDDRRRHRGLRRDGGDRDRLRGRHDTEPGLGPHLHRHEQRPARQRPRHVLVELRHVGQRHSSSPTCSGAAGGWRTPAAPGTAR